MSKARELSKLPNYVLSTVAQLKLSVGKEQGDKAFIGGYYADGDGGGGDFYWDAVSVETDNGGTILQVTGTTTGRWKRIYSGSVSVEMFGTKGDGTTDDTLSIRNAISCGAKTILLNKQSYLVSEIVFGTNEASLVFGKEFIGDNSTLLYNGSTFIFDIRASTPTEYHKLKFENINFTVTNINAGVFNFNDITVAPIDGTGAGYLKGVEFKKCIFYGANVSGTVPLVNGNGIQGVKLMDFKIDSDCYIQGFKRGIYLFGCDNPTISAIFPQNVRHLQLEASGTFGNDALVTSRLMSTINVSGVEDSYCFYDSANHSTYKSVSLEPNYAGKAFMFLNGQGTIIDGVDFDGGAIPVFHIGSSANNITGINWKSAGGNPTAAIIENMQSIDYLPFGRFFGITIINADKSLAIYETPRVRIIKGNIDFINSMPTSNISLYGNNLIKEFNMPAERYCGRSYGIGWTGFSAPDNIVLDNSMYAVKFSALASPKGFAIEIPAKHFTVGDYIKVTIKYRYSGATAGLAGIAVDKNNLASFFSPTPIGVTVSTTVTTFSTTVQLSGIINSDTIQFWVFFNSLDVDFYVYDVSISSVSQANADTSGATLAALETEVNELKAILRKFNLLSD